MSTDYTADSDAIHCACGWSRIILDGETPADAYAKHALTAVHKSAMDDATFIHERGWFSATDLGRSGDFMVVGVRDWSQSRTILTFGGENALSLAHDAIDDLDDEEVDASDYDNVHPVLTFWLRVARITMGQDPDDPRRPFDRSTVAHLDTDIAHRAGLHDDESDIECADCRALFDSTSEEDTVTEPTPAIVVDLDILDEYLRVIAETAAELRVDLARVDPAEAARRIESLIGFYSRQGATVQTHGSKAAFRDLATGLSALTSPHHAANAR